MGRNLVLCVNHVDLVVRVVDEDILCALFPSRTSRRMRRAFVRFAPLAPQALSEM